MGILGQQDVTREDTIVLVIRDHLGMCNYKGSHNVIAILHLQSHQKDRNPSSMYSLDSVGCCCLGEEKGHLPPHQHYFLPLLRMPSKARPGWTSEI